MLDQSAAELRITVEELEKRYDTIENEGTSFTTEIGALCKLRDFQFLHVCNILDLVNAHFPPFHATSDASVVSR